MATKDDGLKIALFCGGAGTRLWPASRESKPKQFQPLLGSQSTFQMMVKRLIKKFRPSDIFPVTGRENVGFVVQQAPEIPIENIIVEPERRDSLAAVGLAALVLDKKFTNPIVLSLWSDHLVKNDLAFIGAIESARQIVEETGKSVEIAVRPTFPSTQLGYLQIGKMLKTINGYGVFEFVRQIEKPNYDDAKVFAESWEYLWHVGFSLWRSRTMLSWFSRFMPEAYKTLVKIGSSLGKAGFDELLSEEYSKLPKMSIDFGILVKLTKNDQLVLTCDLGWSDIGSWDVLKDELVPDKKGNVNKGLVFQLDSKNNLLYSLTSNKLLAVIGLSDYIVVDTEDALLICPSARSHDVKLLVEKIKKAGKKKYL
ncbi:MAG: sugar phosphate nucleotidyltransferase [Nitrososphaerota archaeon]